MADIQPGTNVTVANDIIANGVVVFAGGEQVTVKQVSSNPQRPEYKYAVYSEKAGQWYQLRDQDIVSQVAPPGYQQPPPAAAPQFQAQAPGPAAAPRPARSGASWDFSNMMISDWLVVVGGLLMVIGTFFYFWGFGIIGMLMGLGLIVLVVLDKLVQVPAIADWGGLTWLYIIFGGVGALLGVVGLLQILIWVGGLISVVWYITPVLEILASVLVLVGGIMRLKTE